MDKQFKILSQKEEKELSKEEYDSYYQQLRTFCIEHHLKVTTKGALTVAPKLQRMTEKLSKMLRLC